MGIICYDFVQANCFYIDERNWLIISFLFLLQLLCFVVKAILASQNELVSNSFLGII